MKEKDLICVRHKTFLFYIILAGFGIGYIAVDVFLSLIGMK